MPKNRLTLLGQVEMNDGAKALFATHPAKRIVVEDGNDEWIRLHVKKGHKMNAGLPNEVILEAKEAVK